MEELLSEIELDSQDGYTSPLKSMLIELDELSRGLKEAGFSDRMIGKIIANMLSDAIVYRGESDEDDDEDYEDEEDEDEDSGPDGVSTP